MERIVFVYTTYPSTVEAERAGRTLVERELAACVNILPGMISHYRWQGSVERGEEAVMIIKTRASLAERVGALVKEMHSYATPAILVHSDRKRGPGLFGLAFGANRSCQAVGTGWRQTPVIHEKRGRLRAPNRPRVGSRGRDQ